MANHKSAKKRSRQTLKKSEINAQVLSQLKTNINKFNELLKDKSKENLDKSLSAKVIKLKYKNFDKLWAEIDTNKDLKVAKKIFKNELSNSN